MSNHVLRQVFASAGLALQLVGFVWAWLTATRERQEVGDHGVVLRTWRRLRGSRSRPVYLDLSPAVATSSAMASLSVSKRDESEIERIERELGELRDAFQRYRDSIDQSMASVQGEVRHVDDRLTTRLGGLEALVRDLRGTTSRREVRASLVFGLGVALSIAATLV